MARLNHMNFSQRFKWTDAELSLRELLEKYRYEFPLLIKSTTGFSGYDGGLHEIGSDELFWVFDIQKQSRLVAKLDNGYMSIPMDYPRYVLPVDYDNDICGAPVTIAELIGNYDEDQKFIFETAPSQAFDFSDSSPKLRKRCTLTIMEVVDQYEEIYLLSHSILEDEITTGVVGIPVYMPINVVVAEGFAKASAADYIKFVSEISGRKLPEKEKRISPCTDILFFDKAPMGDYEYISPESFIKQNFDDDDEYVGGDEYDDDYEEPIERICCKQNRNDKDYKTDYRSHIEMQTKDPESSICKCKSRSVDKIGCGDSVEKSRNDERPCNTIPPLPVFSKSNENAKQTYPLNLSPSLTKSTKSKPKVPPKTKRLTHGKADGRPPPPLRGLPNARTSAVSEQESTQAVPGERNFLSDSSVGKVKSRIEEHIQVLPTINDIPSDLTPLSVVEIGRCLQLLNMSQYVESFAEAFVDGNLLVALNEEMLETGLRVSALDARRLMLFAKQGWRPKMI